MDKNDIRYVLRHAKDFIRQSGWIYTTTFTENDKASIHATFDFHAKRWSVAGKLVRELKILLAYPPFDFCFNILDDGSLLIDIYKRPTPKKNSLPKDSSDPRQNNFTF